MLTRLLRLLPPETAHAIAIAALAGGLAPAARKREHACLESFVFGLPFSNPVGLAAGFDKNAQAVMPLLAQGFGFVEAGSVTPRAQGGNPKPRVFRLIKDAAVINRLGFNNAGIDIFAQNLALANRRTGIVGANIGRNKDSEDAVSDYTLLLEAVYAHCDYVAVNVSSPNTQGLRALQEREALTRLLSALLEKRSDLASRTGTQRPLLLKIAPDLDGGHREAVAEVALSLGIDGLIVSNTTIRRPPSLRSPRKAEQGGLSGKPLFALSTEMLAEMYRLTQGRVPLIGVGGIASAEDAYAKIRHGASLVQLYTALIYRGLSLPTRIIDGLARLLERDGFSHIGQAVGADVK